MMLSLPLPTVGPTQFEALVISRVSDNYVTADFTPSNLPVISGTRSGLLSVGPTQFEALVISRVSDNYVTADFTPSNLPVISGTRMLRLSFTSQIQ
jgi:hypothetical protein